jgi:ubiquinone/menaquinone biosynthesis C-methylase UbiE
MVKELRALTPIDHVLELACGTGIWTQELMCISRRFIQLPPSVSEVLAETFQRRAEYAKSERWEKGLRLSLHHKRWNAR